MNLAHIKRIVDIRETEGEGKQLIVELWFVLMMKRENGLDDDGVKNEGVRSKEKQPHIHYDLAKPRPLWFVSHMHTQAYTCIQTRL